MLRQFVGVDITHVTKGWKLKRQNTMEDVFSLFFNLCCFFSSSFEQRSIWRVSFPLLQLHLRTYTQIHNAVGRQLSSERKFALTMGKIYKIMREPYALCVTMNSDGGTRCKFTLQTRLSHYTLCFCLGLKDNNFTHSLSLARSHSLRTIFSHTIASMRRNVEIFVKYCFYTG